MAAPPTHPPVQRKIIHVDMDAFYASVEQRDDPTLKGRPVAVGGSRARGVVAAASYEARAFGVHSAMPSVTALRKCPDLVFVPPRFDVYRSVSDQIRAIFADYTPLVEPLSLDEAYLDVTDDIRGVGSAQAIAEEIRTRIKAATGLTASAGVSYNKFIAKLASDQNKPDGICIITPKRGAAFVQSLPVKRFHGAAVEEVLGNTNAQSTLKLGQARGVVLLAAAGAGLHIGEYHPSTVKKGVVGTGGADKKQIQAMVGHLLPGVKLSGPDAADALAVAITHAHHLASALARARRSTGIGA